MKKYTKLTDITMMPRWAVIIRAIHERGPAQLEALHELHVRGLWLSDAQKKEAGLTDDTSDLWRREAERRLGRPIPDEHWTRPAQDAWRRALLAEAYGAGARKLKALAAP